MVSLDKELRRIDAEISRIGARHGVKTIFELDEMVKTGLVDEADILDDFQELDYLESRRDELLESMKSLNGPSRFEADEENHRCR
ncbi:MAG: hypothetical protein GKC10_03975 [Methanosarcinales archaeon]|nr:hypothetical protein [Methanosarcinales archaeon]